MAKIKEKIEERRRNLTPKQKRKRQIISYTIFFVGLIALVITLFTSIDKGVSQNLADSFKAIADGNHWNFLIALIGLALLYFVLYPIPLMIICRHTASETTKTEEWLIGNSEHFYNGCTPAAVGGQPFQAYAFTNCGVKAGKSTGIILINYISILVVSNIFGLVSLIFYPYYIEALSRIEGSYNWQILGIIGIAGNAVNLAFFCLLGFSRRVRKWLVFLALWLCKWKLFGRFFRKLLPKFDAYLRNTQMATKEVVKHWRSFSLSLICNFLIRCILYSIPFFLLLAVGKGVGADKFMLTLFGTAYSTVSIAWVPTPGNVGAGEFAIAVVLASVTGESFQEGAALGIIYRLFTFYIFVFMSLITNIVFEVKISRTLSDKRVIPNSLDPEIVAASEGVSDTIKEIDEVKKDNLEDENK